MAIEAAEEAEPEPNERTVTVLKLTERLGLTGAGIKVFGDTDWNKKGAAATGQGVMRVICAV